MSKMIMVLAMEASGNNFSGSIPNVLTSCKGLEYLNLSSNTFQGPFLPSLADLQNVQYMDLSCNNLLGMILMAFTKMKMLRHLNLSSNILIGEVPKGGAFATLDALEIMVNLGLYGGWLNLSSCSTSNHKQSSISKKVIIPLLVGMATLITSLLLVAFSYKLYKGSTIPVLKVWPPKISYKELIDGTPGFNNENLIGTSSFGFVYKRILENGRYIVVKVLHIQDDHANQIFSKECNALKRVCHHNVIKIISAYFNLYFKALILPFMANGNLERWLYPPQGSRYRLNMSDRLRIAMEMA